jgi:hypothetical protein
MVIASLAGRHAQLRPIIDNRYENTDATLMSGRYRT